MNERIESFKKALAARCAVKAIAGINNFDLNNILEVVQAADAAGIQAVDVAAQADIVAAVRKATQAVVFASSVEPQALADAVAAGADVAELGNFDALYDQGLFLSADEVLQLAQETVDLVKGQALVSITVPGHLTPESQVKLAQALETLGVDLIQTEGAARVLSAEPTVKSLGQSEKEALTLRNTRVLVEAARLPVMTASGITADNAALAFEAGAAAIGVGSYLKQAADIQDMQARAQAIMANRSRVISQVS